MQRYRNLDGSQISKGIGELLQWKLGNKPEKASSGEPYQALVGADGEALDGAPPFVENNGKLLHQGRPGLTFVGHATFLVELGGLSILVDPIYAPRLAVVKRVTPPGVPFEKLPPIDVVLVTHNHRDHMDAETLEKLSATRPARDLLFIVPKGLGGWFERRKLGRVVELDWWEHHDASTDVRIRFVPSQHWSQRGAFDRNESLWGGYVIEGGGLRVYHSGDTAYFEGFAAIKNRVGRFDAAMLPIGAYEPRWFMKPQHMNPADAVQAFIDLDASRLVAMHWGTFQLTDEPILAPPRFLREVREARRIEEERIAIPSIGETVWLGSSQA